MRGSAEAPVGASICRSGSTSHWHCGTVLAKNETVNYSQGAVHQMTKTSVCAEGGDSGGSFISGDQAQGVTSGGWGDCSGGGETWYQPINEILNHYGLTLRTALTFRRPAARGAARGTATAHRGAASRGVRRTSREGHPRGVPLPWLPLRPRRRNTAGAGAAQPGEPGSGRPRSRPSE